MKSDLLKILDQSLNEISGLHGGSCSRDEINNAQNKLGLNFDKDYIEFLSIYGAGIFDGHIVHGLRKTLLMSEDCWSVVQRTNFYKIDKKWPDINDWYIISDDGRGNPIGCKPDGSVWLSDHDAGFEQVKLADSFEEFLHKLLTDTLYD